MKKIAKGVLITVSAVMALSLVSCNKKGGASKAAKNAPSYQGYTAEIDPSTGKVWDFGGMEVTIYDYWSNPDAPASSKTEEDQRAFRAWLEETYNYKCVQRDLAGWADHPKEITNFIMSGDTSKNVAYLVDGRSAISGVKNNFWYDISKIKTVDFKSSKWNQAVGARLTVGNAQYGFRDIPSEPREGIYFNKRILEENGYDPDYIYDLQKKGKWTWNEFEKMCAKITKDTDNDGVIDQYAMSSFYSSFGVAAIVSNGDAPVVVENGKYVEHFGTDKSMEALNWAYNVYSKYQLPQGDGQWDYWLTAFMNGETAFMCHQEYAAQPNGTLSSMKDDWGWACFPLGPKSNGKNFGIGDTQMMVIPSIYDDATAGKIAKIIDLYTTPVPGYDGPDSWKQMSYYQGFRDERALEETSYYMLNNTTERIDTLIPDWNGDWIYNSIFHSWGKTPAETYEAEKGQIQACLDNING